MSKQKYIFLLVLLLGNVCFAANIVVNGGFESGAFSPSWSLSVSDPFTCVVKSDNPDACGTTGQPGSSYVNSGSYGAFLGYDGGNPASLATGSLSQLLSGASGNYVVSYYLTRLRTAKTDPNDPTPSQSMFQVFFDGIQVGSDLTGIPDLPYQPYAFNIAFDGNATLDFRFYNIFGEFGLDDVSVANADVPEPSTMVLTSLPLAALWFWRRRK